MSAIQLSRAQRREMKKLAERVDRVAQADARFFERFPHRRHRVRLASEAETGQYKIIDGRPVFLPPGCRFFVAVRKRIAASFEGSNMPTIPTFSQVFYILAPLRPSLFRPHTGISKVV
jgi:hypothetical protein